MNAMADTVIKKKNDEERRAAKRAIDAAMEKERQDEMKDKQKKDALRKRDQDVLKTLDIQMQERKEMRQKEKE